MENLFFSAYGTKGERRMEGTTPAQRLSGEQFGKGQKIIVNTSKTTRKQIFAAVKYRRYAPFIRPSSFTMSL